MSDDRPLNPVEFEALIKECSDNIERGPDIIGAAEAKYEQAVSDYELAFAKAYMNHEGPAHEKKYAAVRATQVERERVSETKLVFRHAERTLRALEARLRSLQSRGASVRAMYGAQS
jgi:hypothetical protein